MIAELWKNNLPLKKLLPTTYFERKNNILYPNQFGFRNSLPTPHAMLKIRTSEPEVQKVYRIGQSYLTRFLLETHQLGLIDMQIKC